MHRDLDYLVFPTVLEWEGLPKFLSQTLDIGVPYCCRNQTNSLIEDSDEIREMCINWGLYYDALGPDRCEQEDEENGCKETDESNDELVLDCNDNDE